MALYVAKVSNEQIRQIALEYLLDFATMETVAKANGTSASTISGILFRGVAENILDDITAEAVANKAMSNTDNIVRTRRRWQSALKLRELPALKAELEYKKQKRKELQFQLETYEDYFIDESNAPSKKSLNCTIGRLTGEIRQLENYIQKIGGAL